MNRHLFKEGELVISLSGRYSERSQPKVKGALYKVCQIKFCCNCGTQAINIGVKLNLETHSNTSECACSCVNEAHGLWWTNSKRFIRPEHLEDLMIKRANEEDYEGAAEIRTMIDSLKSDGILAFIGEK